MTNMRYVHEYWLSMAHLEIMTNSDLSFSVLTWPDWIGWSHGRWVTRSMQLQCLIWIKGGNRRRTKVNLTARLFYAFGHAKEDAVAVKPKKCSCLHNHSSEEASKQAVPLNVVIHYTITIQYKSHYKIHKVRIGCFLTVQYRPTLQWKWKWILLHLIWKEASGVTS